MFRLTNVACCLQYLPAIPIWASLGVAYRDLFLPTHRDNGLSVKSTIYDFAYHAVVIAPTVLN